MPTVTFDGSSYTLRAGESVLDALLRGGANITFSCRKGSCQSCMMRATEGDPGEAAQRGLRPALAESGHFLPCLCHPDASLELAPPDLSQMVFEGLIASVEPIGPGVARVLLEPELQLDVKPGQFINLTHDGATRSYSVSSLIEEDYFLELHVKLVEGGQVSTWVHEELQAGDFVTLQGPLGACTWREEFLNRPLLLVGTGTGIAPLHGIVRDAIRHGHDRPITVLHGAADMGGLYLHEQWRELAARHAPLTYVGCTSRGEPGPGAVTGRVTEHMFAHVEDPTEVALYLCGNPDMVFDARVEAVLHGVQRANILADPFEPAHPFMPDDAAKIASVSPDPELWQALDEGEGLRAILDDFYTRTYEDARLSPFFHNVTKQRAISKQYAFLTDLLTGRRAFFGLRPFNAHHWMVISDELFDYREELMEQCARDWGLDEAPLRRWMAMHERFRREIVKPTARGLIVDGVEHLREGYSLEHITVATICDGCFEEILEGATARMHQRTGELFCMACGGRALDS